MRKRILFIVFMVSLVAVLAACGGKDEPEPVSNQGSVAAAASEVVPVATDGDPVHGEELYMVNCVACHGADGKGVPGLGKSLHASDSEFVQQNSDAELIEFIKVGRQPGDPLNTTGVAMPPRGGSPALQDGDIADIVAYLRSLQ